MKKKIIHIAFKHSSNDTRIFRKQCVSLAKIPDYDVTYITSNINSSGEVDCREQGVYKKIIEADPRRIIRQFRYLIQIKKIIKSLGKIDIVELHEAPLLLLALWLQRRGIKVIFDSHENYYSQIKHTYGRKAIYKWVAVCYKLYEKHVCRRISGVIFPCKMLEEDPFDYGVKRLVYLDNYPILSSFNSNINKDETSEKDPYTACYTGAISYERGVVHDIQAWSKAGIAGILAGKFANKKLEDDIKGMEEFKNVDFRGYCGPDEINEIYLRSSVGMATLLNYGQYHKSCNLPTKVCEYMMFSIPTIIYRTEYVEQVMGKYEFGIMVNPEHVEEIADALIYLKDHPSEAERMGKNGRRAVEEVFNWEAEEKKLFALYDEILNDEK
ncbi:glycosyltransferase family 4 protein [Zhenpiania hominis]|uniref:Glycosyltransferase family 4 protein n=1 Tax=Zhenpiania hominis TaxID=2763644 RepID=A0A923NPJ1_9FIRM|nr:glycosyltransferase family 4 protein [Zhenpiania hominis]MBC6680867.1 glycosyltransferase family 4 protein [Zhenpiania hominis]